MGRPPECNPCCSTDGFDPPECGVCDDEDYPECFEFTISGVTDSTCTNCDLLNDTFVVKHGVAPYTSDCNWFYCLDDNFPELSTCRSDRIGFRFQLTSLRVYRMTANCAGVYGQIAHYSALSSAYDCENHSIVLNRQSATACANWPATITVSQAACP